MSFAVPPPTLASFTAWVRSAMGVTTAQLPDDSVFLQYAFEVAVAIVNLNIQCASPLIYNLAVYNLGGDNLINWAQDPEGAPIYVLPDGTNTQLTFFAYLRQQYGCNDFTPGFVSSASDEGTSVSIQYLESLKDLTLTQLQNTKTPYGRQYLGFAASIGTDWGIS